MTQRPPPPRIDPRAAVRRDARRLARREQGAGGFWRSMSVLGMVGWPIALGSAGGAWIGHWLDQQLHTGARCTLILLAAGVLLGAFAAWKTLTHDDPTPGRKT